MAEFVEAERKYLLTWIGREHVSEDTVTLDLAQRFAATFDDDPEAEREGAPAPIGIHWCLCLPKIPTSKLGQDGTIPEGDLVPPVPLPRRMRAGGGTKYFGSLNVGDAVRRRSYVKDISFKQGRSGLLCFVETINEYSVDGKVIIEDRIDTVFREAYDDAVAAKPRTAANPTFLPDVSERLDISTVLMLRYSAITFNAHRIHFDHLYSVQAEGYAGILVHGPLQATLLLRAANRTAGGKLKLFEFRALAPLIQGQPTWLASRDEGDIRRIMMMDDENTVSMAATFEA